jgi:hypothetical protein
VSVAFGKEPPSAYATDPESVVCNDRRTVTELGPDVRLLRHRFVGDPVESDPMWTAYDLEQSWRSVRTNTMHEVSLFLTLESEEFRSAFLKFYNDWLERKIVALTPAERAPYIGKLINDVLIRLRAIEAAAIINRTVH